MPFGLCSATPPPPSSRYDRITPRSSPYTWPDCAAGASTPHAALARRMQHEKRPRDEAGASAYGLADKRARLAPRVSFAAGTPWLPAFATPATLSKVRARRLRCQLRPRLTAYTCFAEPPVGGAGVVPEHREPRAALRGSARRALFHRARAAAARLRARYAVQRRAHAAAAGFARAACSPALRRLARLRRRVLRNVVRAAAASPEHRLRRQRAARSDAPAVAAACAAGPRVRSVKAAPRRGRVRRPTGAPLLAHVRRCCAHWCPASAQGYLNFVQLVQERRPDAAPQFVAWDSARRASEPALAGASAGGACESRRSLRPRRSAQRSAHACCCCLGLRHGKDCGASAT